MTHTNVQIPRRFGELETQLGQVKVEAERKFWQETAEYLLRELDNIPEAIIKYGYVTLPDGTRLVPEEPEAPSPLPGPATDRGR